ncbi:hypothetical protein N568_0106935 [Lactococcus garvieae TRF1]|uniref:Gram-positive cocci surface proteins LPxTG domain-containing protein n=1 Tax=Lactococcus garvieae TRF1 TaxID=1380772 RepID=V8AQ03_9LACT|nr:hypothetical protein N568_0106935 [Lactococcus garvieae TRF1]
MSKGDREMNKILKGYIMLCLTIICIVGNNQIAHAAMGEDMVSRSSIYFDQPYTPPDPHPVIPDGNTALPLGSMDSPSQNLPKAGDEGGKLHLLGLVLLFGSLVSFIIVKKQKEITKN